MLNQIPERRLLLPHFIKQLSLTGKMPVYGAASHSRRISDIRQGRVGHSRRANCWIADSIRSCRVRSASSLVFLAIQDPVPD
jgi:hypothetical protein